MRIPTLLAVFLAGYGLQACRDLPTVAAHDRVGNTLSALSRSAASVTSGATAEVPSIMRFAVDFQISGGLHPNEPIGISVTTTANLPADNVEVSVVSPDLALMRLPGMVSQPVPAGIPLVPQLLRTHAHLNAGAAAMDNVSLRVPRPGYYRVTVVVRSKTAPAVDNGRFVQNVATVTKWLYVSTDGGRATGVYDPSVFPDSLLPSAGPLRSRPVRKGLCTPGDPTCGPSYGPAYQVTIMYHNVDTGNLEPLKQASITVSDYGGTGAGNIYSGYTDNSGQFWANCPANANGQQEITVGTSTTDEVSLNTPLLDYITVAGFCASGASSVDTLLVTNDAFAWTHQQFVATVPASRSLMAFSRPLINVSLNPSNQTSTSYYDPNSDEIYLFGSSLYGDYGRFTVAHEYGHALAEKALGGARGGGCPSPHYLDQPSGMQCAVSEGWADYHSVMVRGTADGQFYDGVRTNAYYHGGDGSVVEGAVASFYYAVTAPAGTYVPFAGSNIALYYPSSFVAYMYQGCMVETPNFGWWLGITVDDFIWCMEDGVTPSLYQSYFTTKSVGWRDVAFSYPYAYPSGWSSTAIRQTWLHQLYGQ